MAATSTNITVTQNLAVLAQQTEPATTGLVLQAVLWGCYALLLSPTVFAILRRRPRSRPWHILLGITALMFAMSTTCFILEIVNTMGLFHGIMMETKGLPDTPPSAWFSFKGANDRTLAQAIVFSFEFMLGDGVVIWRAAGLWGFSRTLMAIMLVPLLADFSVFLYFLGCEGETEWWYIAGTQAKHCNEAQRAMFLLSFSTNIVATAFIILKAWQHRDAFVTVTPMGLRSRSSEKKYRSPAQKIMLLLIESGLIYMVFWAACSFTYFPFVQGFGALGSAAYYMTSIFNSIRYQVVGLYPTVIIYLVQRQSTSWDTPELTKSLANFRASPRQFERDVEKSEDDASTDVHGTSTTQGMTGPSMSFASGMFGSTVQEKAKGERLGHQHSASDDTAVAKMESKTDDLSVS